MFEGWAADVLASYLGKYLELPRDRLRISLWGGEGILEDVQLRVEAFEYLQLPFAVKEGSVGRLKLQIPWGRWRGGPLVVELSDVVLCVAPREESDWEEGPALRRAQAAKQAQLAAAELAKLGSRVAATGSSTGAKPAMATSTAGSATSWGLAIADYVLSFLLNRLQFAVKNIHVYFQAPENCSSEYEAFGVKLASLSTVAAGDAPSVLSLFPALQSASAAATAAAKIIRQLHVQGWSCYWKSRRQQQSRQQQRGPAHAPHGPAAGSSDQPRQRQAHRHLAPKVESQDYLLAPVEAVLQVTVHTSGAGSASTGGSSGSAGAGVLSSGLACDVFLGAEQVSMQLSSQQLVGMARLADDAAIWSKRARYGCFRPPGWITAHQAARQGLCWHDSWHEGRSAAQHSQQQDELDPGAAGLSRTVSGSSSSSVSTGVDDLRSSSFSSAAGSCLVPTGRNGVGAPVTWKAVWQYAVQSVLANVRDRRRQQGCWSVQRNDLLARRRYVHVYQQKLDALQPKAAVAADNSIDSTAESKAEGTAAAGAAAADSSSMEGSAALQSELQRLEQQLCVEDILLCRSLAELALERRSSSSDAERCRSWFAWGASSISGYLYPSAQPASSNSTTTPSKATPSKQALSGGGAGATMPTEADLDELLEILHIRNSGDSDTGGVPAPSEEAAAALEAAQQAAGSRAAPDSKPSGLATTAVIALKWQVLRLRAALQDCPAVGPKRELLVLDIEGTSITGNLQGGNLSAQLALQDVRLFDCCTDPGVHECVLQRLDPASPVAAVGGQLLSPSRGWGSGLTGLALSQAQGLQRMSPEAFGWSGNAMPAVASGAHMRHAAGGPGGVSGAPAAGRGLAPALLTIGLEVAGTSKHVSVKLEPLQVLARPGCVVAVNSMLEQLPQDTLQQQLAAAQTAIESAPGYAAGQPTQAPAAAAPAPGPRTVRFSDASQVQHQQPTRRASPAMQQQQQLPPALLQLQLTFLVSELLLVLPTELHYASGTNAVLHLQGLKLAAAQAAAAAIPAGSPTPPGEPLQYDLSSSSSSSRELGNDKPQQLPQQQQLSVGLSSLFFGVHQSFSPESLRHGFDAVPEHMYSQRQASLQEVLKLPPIQGTVWLTGTKRPTSAQRRCSSEAANRQALVKVSLQVPPVSCCLSASLVATLQQAAAAVKWQSQLLLPEHVATYSLPLQQQLELAAAKLQPQDRQDTPVGPAAGTAPAAAGAADVNDASVAGAGSRTPSPTESEVAQWLAAPASAAPTSDATDVDAESAPQLLRCDSDKLLQRQQLQVSHSQQASGRWRSKQEKHKQQLNHAHVAALFAVPEVLLLDLEVLLEELDIQYIHDVGADKQPRQQDVQQAQQQATSPQRADQSDPSTATYHMRLQASLLSVGFKHSTHGSQAEAGLKDLVLQDVLADAAAGQHASAATATGLPGLLQLISSVSVEELQVVWSQHISQLAVLQEVQVALEGLQIQGQPGDVGLFLLPAAADAGSSITAAVRTSSPHPVAATSSSAGSSKGHSAAAVSTFVAVGVQNLALGIDGLLRIAAAFAGPKDNPQDSGSDAGHTAAPTQQQRDKPADTAGNKPALTLEVELSQVQLLSCSSARSSEGHNTRWPTADSFTQKWQPLQDAAAIMSPGVACELLLDLPTASFSLQPGKHLHPMQPQQQSVPRLLLQDLAVYLPGAPQADVLRPVLHIPRVLFAGGPEVQQEQEQRGFAAVLEQQGECHRLSVPAVATSLRPPQLQHLVLFVDRQEQQWQTWTATTAAAGSSDVECIGQMQDRQPVQGTGQMPARADQQQTSIQAQAQQSLLSVEVGDVQVLLLPADGTSDKGLLLHWQQLEAAVLKHPKQPQQASQAAEAASGQAAPGDAGQAILQRTQVSWRDLTVSAIQQEDMQQHGELPLQQHLAPEGSEQLEPSQDRHSKLAGLQQGVYHAHELPAVAWLSQGLGSAGRQQQGSTTRRRQSSHASAGAAGPQPNGLALNSHATLSRFLSSQESWRDAASLPASVDSGAGFFTPKGSASLRSTGSWLSARSSSLSAALSLQTQQQHQPLPQQQQAAAPPGGAAAAAAAAVGPGNIIAAWWQAEPPGQSPPGISPAWLQASSSLSAALPGWGSLPQAGASCLASNPASAGGQQQQLGGRSPPRKGVRRSSSFRRGIPAGALQLAGRTGQQGAASVRSSLSLPMGAAAAVSVHSLGLDDGMTDADVEFYSIAGDSDDDADNLSAVGSPLGLDGAEDDATWLRCWELLPLAGFGSQGCHVAASWLLLSLSATAKRTQQPALQLDMWRDVISPGGAAVAGTSQLSSGQTSRQVTAVTSEGLQLQLSSRNWDLVAACILQAVNASKPARLYAHPKDRAQPRQGLEQPSQQPQASLPQLHVGLQALQVALFVPPDTAEVPMQSRTVVMRGGSGRGGGPGSSSGAQDLHSGRRGSGAFAPWQDPGSEPTTPTAVAGLQAQQRPMLPAAAASSSQAASPAAQMVLLKLSADLDLVLPAHGQPGRLQQVSIPAASVQLGAAPWDTTTGRLLATAADVASSPQQQQLLLLLARGIYVVAGSATGGAAGTLGPFAAVASPGNRSQAGQHLQVGVSSISGWVSTTRLSLLLNIQQQLMQQLPALTAAAAMAGPSYSAHAAGYAAGSTAPPGQINRNDFTSAASLATSASMMNGYVATSSSMRRRSMDQQASAGQRLVPDNSIDVCVHKVAILVSTDEPEPWLLQQQQQQSPRRAGSSASSPDRGMGLGMQADAAGAVRSPGMGTLLGRLAAPAGYAPLSTCSTPLIEVALLPLEVKLQLLKPCGLRKGGAGQTVVQVGMSARVRADVYSVDKLGWEPVLDPWAFKVDVSLTPSAPAGSGTSGTRVSASVSSSEVMELTAAPSCIIASKQLQALVSAAKTWQGEHALMQQLLHHLSAPAAGSCLTAAGASCWLVNKTGVALSYVVADAIMEPTAATAALSTCSSSASSVAGSPVKPPPSSSAAARVAACARGQAAHLTPVPLRVLDVAAAGYFGRFVEQGGVSDAAFKLQPLQPGQATSAAAASGKAVSGAAGEADTKAAGSGASGGSAGVKQSQLLYVQAAGRVDVVGPVALSQMGCSVYPLKGLAAGAALSPGSAPGHISRRSRQAPSLVVEVSRHRYGGRLVSVHSNIQLVNNSGLTLQLGYMSPMGLSPQPLPLAMLAPGDAVWLPLQVLQASTPSLCVKPTGLLCSYSWCKALDVYALLPDSSSTAVTSGFWYEPAGSAAAPRVTSQFLSFAPQPADSDGASGHQVSRVLQHGDASATVAAAAAAVGSLVLAVGASARPWPAGVAVHDASSTGASHGGSVFSRSSRVATGGGQVSSSGSLAALTLWQLVVEPPAVLVNQLPVSVEVSVVAGKGEVRGLAALIDSRQELPLYGCEAAYYSKLRVQVPGFHSSSWIPLNTAVSSSSVRAAMRHVSDPGAALRHNSTGGPVDGPAAAGRGPRYSDAGGMLHPGADSSEASAAAVPDALQLLDQRQVVLTGLQAHQPPQVLQLHTLRNKLTGALTVTVSCSLWIFNCLGSQIAMRQAGTVADAVGSVSTLPGAGYPQAAAKLACDMVGSTSGSQVLWLPPYPWMSRVQGSGSSSDLVGLGAAAAGTSSQGPASLASAWAAARRSDTSAGGSSRSALQRSRSTPSLVASTAGLEFLAVTPAPVHTPSARATAPASAPRSTGLSAYQRRASRTEQQQQEMGAWTASTQVQAGPLGVSPFAAAAGVASPVTSSRPTAGAMPFAQQHSVQRPLDNQQQPHLSVRRSFSASAQIQVSSAGSVELPANSTDTAQSAFQQSADEAAWQQRNGAVAGATAPGLPRAPRTRRHSSGLHMLASGKLPQQLLPQLQVPDSSAAPPAGCSSFDLLSPTHQQRLSQQMHFQQAAVATGSAAQLPQSASASNLAFADGCQAVVLPLMKPDMSGWLPLLAGGDLNQLTAAAAAFSGPVNTAEVIVAPAPGTSVLTVAAASEAAMQQRVAAAAAADHLLADMPGAQHPAQHHTEQAPRGFGSPPSSVSRLSVSQVDGLQHARPPSIGGYSQYSQHSQYGHPYGQQYSASAGGAHVVSVAGPGLAGLAAQSHQSAAAPSFQPQHTPGSIMRRPSGSWSGAGFADLAAAAAASHVAAGNGDVGLRGLPGSVGGGLSAAPPGYAASYRSTAVVDAASSTSCTAAVAAPVMCGWPVHMFDSSSSGVAAASKLGAAGPAVAAAANSACGFVELQLCAAPAAVAAAMVGKGLQQLPEQWSLPTRVPLLGSQASPGPCSIVKLPLSVPPSAAAAAGQLTGSAGAAAAGPGGTSSAGFAAQSDTSAAAGARRKAVTRGRAAGAAGQQEQGACFVSVHTAAIPGGGGAWAVHLLPTYVLVNTLATEVQLRQCDSELVLQTVAPGGHCCVLWPNAALPLKLQFRVDEPGWSWSGAASVDAPGEFLVKIRHRSRGETLLLQLDVAASSSGIVATLSGRQGGFAPYRIDNCSAEVLHVQQAGCAEQEDVLRPYSSLPYAWDEPSMPHKVLLFLRGHRPLGEFALEKVGQVRKVAIPSSSRDHLSRSHTKRLLLITTYAEGPMRVLRVLDTHSHLLQQPAAPVAVVAQALPASVTGLDALSSRGSFASIADAGLTGCASSTGLSQQQQGLSRPSSTSSLQGAAASSSSTQMRSSPAASTAAAQVAGTSAAQQLNARNRTLRLLSAFLAPSDSSGSTAAESAVATSPSIYSSSASIVGSNHGSSTVGALKIAAPSLDVRVSLDGCGLSLVSDSRELLYSSVRGVMLRFCQDPLRNAVGAAIASMRVENTLYLCQYPLMLASPVSRSVFGVVYPPGPQGPSTAAGSPPAAADTAESAKDGLADAKPVSGSSGAGASSSDPDAAVTAAVAAAAAAAADAAGLDASSIAHAVADELQQQEHVVHAKQGSSQQPAAPAPVFKQPSRSNLQRLKPQQLPQQAPQQLPAMQMLQPHHLALGVLATVWRTQPSGVVCVEQLGLHLSPLALSLEGKHLKQLMEFGAQVAAAAAGASREGQPAPLVPKGRGQSGQLAVLGVQNSTSTSAAGAAYGGALQHSWPPVQPPSLPAAATTAFSKRLKLYFEEWFVPAITLCISFAPGSWFDPSPAGLASAWSGSNSAAAVAAVAAEAAAADAAAAQVAPEAAAGSSASGAAGNGSKGGVDSPEPGAVERTDSATAQPGVDATEDDSKTGNPQESAAAADAGAAAAAVAAASSSPLPVYLQMALALAHAEEGAWLTLAPFSSTHIMINTESLVQVLGRHYILAAYQELPKVLASLDIFGDPARLLQALGLGFWNLVTLPAHSARWGPYRSLQRLLRGMRVMAYGVSNSIAKGSKRSKAALLPLAPDGLSWQQQQQPTSSGWGGASSSGSSSLALYRPGLGFGSLAAVRSGSIWSAADAAAVSGSNQPGSGQDLLHVLVAGYSLTFQHLLRSFQSGQPLRGVVRAAAQALVLPALLLLETSESTASSFVRLLAEQVPGAVALRVPRYVASGQLLRPYDRMESLGRALLHHLPGPFVREEFLGCVELQQGLYAVVTVGHLLLLACRTTPAASAVPPSAPSIASTSSKSSGIAAQSAVEQLPAQQEETAGAAAARQQTEQQQQRRQRQRAGCVQYKDPQVVFVLDLRDVMMVAAEGSNLRLLCMAGDPAMATAVAGDSAARQSGQGQPEGSHAGSEDGGSSWTGDETELVGREGSGSAGGVGLKGGDGQGDTAASTSGLRELLPVAGNGSALAGIGRLQQRLPATARAGSSSVPTAAGAGVQAGVDRVGRWQALGSVVGMTDAELERAAAGAAAAVAAAAGGGLMGMPEGVQRFVVRPVSELEGEESSAAAQPPTWGGCKWFVGHQVPCGSDDAALQLQQLLERACQRVEALLASSAWPRQLML